MGNSQTKEARGSSAQSEAGAISPGTRPEQSTREDYVRPSPRTREGRHGSRSDLSAFLGLGGTEPDIASLEARRESKAEREARKQEKEKQARLKERERSMKEEHVDGGYLVTQGVYVGIEDFHKPLVRQLMIERRLAPFWRGLNDFSESWAEHQIMAVARGMPLPAPDEVPPELEYQLSKRPSADAGKSLTIPMGGRTQSFQSDSGRASPANGSLHSPSFLPSQSTSSSMPFRSRAKTLASLGSASRNNSEKDLTPPELKLPHDPFVNGQPIEVFLYKDASECPICFLYYPPYLNTTRCCEQPICSECFVQIKRPDPHPPEHNDPDPNAPPVTEEERLAQAEGLLVSEVASCPYCKQPEFGITYSPPSSFRRGLTYVVGNQPYSVTSAKSSQTSIASSNLSPGPGRRRGTSLSAAAPEVITTDKIRPDWANKLAAARAHAARRSAAASALHAAAYLMNDQAQRAVPGPFGRRNVLRRSTLENNGRPSDAQLSALSFLADRHAASGGPGGNLFLAPPRGSSSRRSREDEIEGLMMMEAIRLSLAAEEERRKKEEKEAKKKAKKEEKEQRKADKVARKNGHASSPLSTTFPESSAVPLQREESNSSSIAPEETSKGKSANRDESPPSLQFSGDVDDFVPGMYGPPSFSGTSQESLTPPVTIPSATEPLRRSHLRQMSNASSASSSYQEQPVSTSPGIEPMFNFQSLAAMIDQDEKSDGASHVEHAESLANDEKSYTNGHHASESIVADRERTEGQSSKLKEVMSAQEVQAENATRTSR